MFLPLRTDSPLRRTPYMNWAIIALNIIVFGVQFWYEHTRGLDWTWGLLRPRHPALWEFFSYQFLHGSPMHLIGNMLFLWLFGNNVNDKVGHLGYLALYLAGGVFAGVSHVIVDSNPVLGASGSIAAITGAYLVLLPRSHVTVLYFFYLIGMIEIPSMWFILGFFALDIFQQTAPALFGGKEAVAQAAHIGGTIFGFGVCMTLLAFHLLPRDHFDVLALLERWNKRRQYRDLVSRGYNPFGYIAAEPKRGKPDPNQEQIQDLRAQIAADIAHHKLDVATKQYLELLKLDPRQVLSKQNQLDVANQLFQDGDHRAAANAYELFLATYPRYEQHAHVELMLGVLYARYLQQLDKAKAHLTAVLPKLHANRDVELAKEELKKIEAITPEAGSAV